MKIAFVNQPIDTILPPNQNSVGACTYGLARSMGKSCEVVAYGTTDRNKDRPTDFREQNVHFRLFGVQLFDRLVATARKKSAQIFPIAAPASTSGLLFPGFGRFVAEDLRHEACDVIHIQQGSQYVPLIRAKNPTAKIVLHLHNRWFSQVSRPALEYRLRGVDLVTTVSDFIRNHIRQEFLSVADRCETFYNGIDANEFVHERDYKSTAGRTKQLLFIGAVSPHSGVHVLLEAFKAVLCKYPDVHLSIVGHHQNFPLEEVIDLSDSDQVASVAGFYVKSIGERLKATLSLDASYTGKYLSDLKERLSPEIAGKVRFWGGIGDRFKLVQHYYDADVFVFPPVCDHGFGLPAVEAMAAGVPCVVTRSGGTVETVKNNETGILVEKNDPAALARAIIGLLDSDRMREAMGRAARRRALEHFTWDMAAQRTLDRYLRLCGVEPLTLAEPCMAATENEMPNSLDAKDRVASTEASVA